MRQKTTIITPLASTCIPILIMNTPNQRSFFIHMENNSTTIPSYTFTPIKVAVLIDGGFFMKRYNALYNRDGAKNPIDIANDLYTIAHAHVGKNNYLYRIFYYDCEPFDKKVHNPISHKCINFAKTSKAIIQRNILNELKKKRKVALRLGILKDNKTWVIRPKQTAELLKNNIQISDLKEEDIAYDLRQKGIDMKIGVDIASLALKHFVDKIVLISGDSDFVPAAKLARREGVDFVLDPMELPHIENSLYEHIDGLRCFHITKNGKVVPFRSSHNCTTKSAVPSNTTNNQSNTPN